MRKSDLKELQLREAHLKRLTKALEVSDQGSPVNVVSCQPRTRLATAPMRGGDGLAARGPGFEPPLMTITLSPRCSGRQPERKRPTGPLSPEAAAPEPWASPDPQWLTSEQVSRRLEVSMEMLAAWRKAGEGPPWLQVGAEACYDKLDFEGWMERTDGQPLW